MSEQLPKITKYSVQKCSKEYCQESLSALKRCCSLDQQVSKWPESKHLMMSTKMTFSFKKARWPGMEGRKNAPVTSIILVFSSPSRLYHAWSAPHTFPAYSSLFPVHPSHATGRHLNRKITKISVCWNKLDSSPLSSLALLDLIEYNYEVGCYDEWVAQGNSKLVETDNFT